MKILLAVAMFVLMSGAAFAASTIHEFTMDALNGTPTPLANFKGKVMLVVKATSIPTPAIFPSSETPL